MATPPALPDLPDPTPSAAVGTPDHGTPDDGTPEVFRRLGLRACVNASGHVTRLGGSLMPPQVTAAMVEAAGAFVPLEELHAAAGRRIAELTGAEAALVTSGACGAIVLGAAACIAGSDPDDIRRLPDSFGLPNRVLVPPTPRLTWAHFARIAGGDVIECADPEDLAAHAADHETAMILWLPSVHGEGPIRLDDVLAIARDRGIPLMVDAADKLPPADSLHRYHELGVDLVGVSGGKGLWGPQSTGLLMGRANLIEAAYLNANAPGIGRPMKVSKEEIVAVVTALEVYLARDHDADAARWEAQIAHVERALAGLAGVRCEHHVETHIAEGLRLRIYLPPGLELAAARRALAEGSPRVMVGLREGALVVNPQTLQPGQERAVAAALVRVLGSGTRVTGATATSR